MKRIELMKVRGGARRPVYTGATPSGFAGALQEADEWKHRYEQQQLRTEAGAALLLSWRS